MKTVSISFLLLVAFPIHLMAQDSTVPSDAKPKYFVYSPKIIKAGSNHITEPSNTSNRKSSATEFKLPELTTTFVSNPLKLNDTPASNSFRIAKLETAPQVIEEPVIEIPNEAGDFKPLSQVTRPTPSNTAPVTPEPPAVTSEPVTVERNFQEVFREDATVMPERVSLDDIQMAQRTNSWEKKPNTMRDIVDHFSPGGEPFARRNIVGTPNFFGVDRHSCCDEWEGQCNCSGGLKGNPGHLGIPWLRSKDNCESTQKAIGKHRVRRAANDCGCASCCK